MSATATQLDAEVRALVDGGCLHALQIADRLEISRDEAIAALTRVSQALAAEQGISHFAWVLDRVAEKEEQHG